MSSSDSKSPNNNLQKIISIKNGFKINHMKMKNGENGETLWECSEYNLENDNRSENLPKEILDCSVITREINFSSEHSIENLELIQNFYLSEELIESSRFYFGFVIPNSTNNWEQVIEAKPKEEMIPYHYLSGNLVVETIFITSNTVIFKNRILIYYV